MFGVDLHYQDGKEKPGPTVVEFEKEEELLKWFNDHPKVESTTSIRLLCVHADQHHLAESLQANFDIPFDDATVEHALWQPEVYRTLACNRFGGVASLLDEPYRFILQTPRDDGPFCSLAMSRRGTCVKGIYTFTDDVFHPTRMHASGTVHNISGWRSKGLQLVTLPLLILQAQSSYVSLQLANVIEQVSLMESTLASATPDQIFPDLPFWSRQLHTFSSMLTTLERHSRFSASILAATTPLLSQTRTAVIEPHRNAIDARRFDFDHLPLRIANLRATIAALHQQRNEQLNLELAHSSRRIAEATLSDAKSMRTIAILTMVFLPGTAVASFFSMDVFNFNAESGANLASKWLWIYFVITVPLTIAVLLVWYVWSHRRHSVLGEEYAWTEHGTVGNLRDVEEGRGQEGRENAIGRIEIRTGLREKGD